MRPASAGVTARFDRVSVLIGPVSVQPRIDVYRDRVTGLGSLELVAEVQGFVWVQPLMQAAEEPSSSFRNESAHHARSSRTTSGPKNKRASYALCARHRSSMFSTVAPPPTAWGSTWWNSRNARSPQRPSAPTNAQDPPSRRHTARRTAAGMWREGPGPGFVARARSIWAKRWRSSWSTRSVTARSKIWHLGAVAEHRCTPLAQIQPPGVDFHQCA